MKAETGDDSDHESLHESEGVRLQRFLASTGLGSRRKCEEIIVAGRVTIDGEVKRDLGTRVDPRRQRVSVDGHAVRQEPHRYFLLNKPAGFLCTNSDPAGRPRAIDLVPAGRLRLFTVGRLDESSEGLILITNDGELAHRLAHPRFQVPRTYSVQVAGRPTPETFAALKQRAVLSRRPLPPEMDSPHRHPGEQLVFGSRPGSRAEPRDSPPVCPRGA